MNTEYLIVGAGVAGTTAAEAIRSRDAHGTIVLVGDEHHPLYSRVMLPMVADRRIPPEKALLKTEGWYGEHGIMFLRGRRVARFDGVARRAVLEDGMEIAFGRALVATGGRPRRLDVPGVRLPGVFRLQYLEDAIGLRDGARGDAVVVGGGFIGLEFMNAFRHYGLPTTLALREPRIWEHLLPPAASAFLEAHLEGNGIGILRDTVPVGFVGDERVEAVRFSGGTTVRADTVGVGIGLEPNLHFLENVERSARGVMVNEFLESPTAGIFAAGDIAEFLDLSAGHRHALGNWYNAREQGRTAGLNMAGERTPYHQVSSYSITALGMNVAFIGDVNHEGHETVPRVTDDSYGLLFLRGGKLRGGIFMNRIPDRKPTLELIRRGTVVSGHVAQLADAAFDLAQLSSTI